MPLVNNPFWAGNLIWKCQHCGEIFSFVDDGERHERACWKNKNASKVQVVLWVVRNYVYNKTALLKTRIFLLRYSDNELLKRIIRKFIPKYW